MTTLLFPLLSLCVVGLLGLFVVLRATKKIALMFGAKRAGLGWCFLMWLDVSLFFAVSLFLFAFLKGQTDSFLLPLFYFFALPFLIFPLPTKFILQLSYWRAFALQFFMGFVWAIVFGVLFFLAAFFNLSLLSMASNTLEKTEMHLETSQHTYIETTLDNTSKSVERLLKAADKVCGCGIKEKCLKKRARKFNKRYIKIDREKLTGDLKQTVALAFERTQYCLSHPSDNNKTLEKLYQAQYDKLQHH